MSAAFDRPWLLELLTCPTCEGTLVVDGDELRCARRHAFPVVDGIPRFTPRSSYADNFAFQWTTFRTTQLDEASRRESEEAFGPKTGLGRADVEGKTVLDVGCGMGRYTDVVARWGGRVVGVDLTAAVEAGAENLAHHGQAAVAQADLRQLPLAPDTFDVVFSIGVLHHTPNTYRSLAHIARLVKPGGTLAVWVYSRHLSAALPGGEVLRPLTSRMRPETLLRVIRAVQPRLTRLKRRGRWATMAVDFVLPSSNHPDPEWQVLETFDWYSPRYQHKHTYAEVEHWFRRLGFTDVRRLPEPVAISGRRAEAAA